MNFNISLHMASVAMAFLVWPGQVMGATYTATAQIQVSPRGPWSVGVEQSPPVDDQSMENEIEVMESPEVLSPIITDLKLDSAWAKQFGTKPGSLNMQDALNHLRQIAKITRTSRTNVINIAVASENPVEDANIANAIADRYKAMRDNADKQVANMGERELRDQITQQQKIAADASAAATKNPQDTEAQAKATNMNNLLDALKAKLQQVQDSKKAPHSPVLILSRASAAVT